MICSAVVVLPEALEIIWPPALAGGQMISKVGCSGQHAMDEQVLPPSLLRGRYEHPLVD